MGDALMRVRELATLKVSQRLAHTLLRLAAASTSPGHSGGAVPHTLTRQELAEFTGTTLFTVSRILTDWEPAGLVRSECAHVEVTDPQRLREPAEGQDDY
jgi:CRP/FNR family transcriptional regulator, nitrogen oxide reductase regulator